VKSKRWAVTGVFATLFIGAMSAPAMASGHPGSITPHAACGAADYNYVDTGDTRTFARASGAHSSVSGDPGTTLTISRSTTFTVTGSLGVTSSISASAIVATAQSQLNITLSGSVSGTSSSSGAWTVPSSYTNGGALQIGAMKHSGMIKKYHAKPADCSNGAFVSSTTYNAPDDNGWYFHHVKL
jgi:hypothetical protein